MVLPSLVRIMLMSTTASDSLTNFFSFSTSRPQFDDQPVCSNWTSVPGQSRWIALRIFWPEFNQ